MKHSGSIAVIMGGDLGNGGVCSVVDSGGVVIWQQYAGSLHV